MAENIKKTIPITFLFFVIFWISANAEPLVKPVDTKNTLILYIPHLFIPVEGSSSSQAGSNDFSINIIKSNTIFDIYHFSEHGKQGNFDLETTSVYLNYIRTIDDYTEIKMILPIHYHGSGYLDNFIESFHKAFPGKGLKNGGREYSADNEIHIQYQTEYGGPDINKPFYGIGDPSFFIKRILINDNPGITCSLGVKPQTGEKAFINSGTTDFGFSINAGCNTGIYNFYAMAGYSYFYGDGIFKEELEQSRNYLLSSAAGIGARLFDSFYFSVQFYCHTSLYDTGIEKIDYVTIINSYSVRWQYNDQTVIQFCIDEDPITYAGVDIAFSLRCEYTF